MHNMTSMLHASWAPAPQHTVNNGTQYNFMRPTHTCSAETLLQLVRAHQ